MSIAEAYEEASTLVIGLGVFGLHSTFRCTYILVIVVDFSCLPFGSAQLAGTRPGRRMGSPYSCVTDLIGVLSRLVHNNVHQKWSIYLI
jgi:hypothetical protein